MQIFIKESNENQEWYVVDLQGRLEHSGDLNGLRNETLGTLSKKENTKDDFIFTIGNSVLNGKRVPLKKPLLVIKKIRLNENDDDEMKIDDNKQTDENQQQSNIEYSIEGIAYNKIQFTTRPTTFIPQSSVVYGSPTHKSPSSSPNNSNKTLNGSPISSPIKQPEFNDDKIQQKQ